MTVRLLIDSLGSHGDGIARTERGQVFVPFTLPGEVVNAAVERDRGTLMAVVEPSPHRVEPPCRHFGTCGGCSLQHMEAQAYRAFKAERVAAALKRAGMLDEPSAAAFAKVFGRDEQRLHFGAGNPHEADDGAGVIAQAPEISFG